MNDLAYETNTGLSKSTTSMLTIAVGTVALGISFNCAYPTYNSNFKVTSPQSHVSASQNTPVVEWGNTHDFTSLNEVMSQTYAKLHKELKVMDVEFSRYISENLSDLF